ncbi:hypothetical protein FQA39_LY04575 [Lamprigera yunnana]|nr:hypothetical protein FQA39_LY04575 [Lamprigera yunnana]
MQLFHELEQQFPSVPDHIVTACISAFANRNVPEGNSESESSILEVSDAARALRLATENDQELMNSKLMKPIDPATSLLEPKVNYYNPKAKENTTLLRQERFEMNECKSDINQNVVKAKCSGDTIGFKGTGGLASGLQLIAAVGRYPKVSPADGLLESATTVYALPFGALAIISRTVATLKLRTAYGYKTGPWGHVLYSQLNGFKSQTGP